MPTEETVSTVPTASTTPTEQWNSGQCTTTLAKFCGSRCPTYAESVDQLRGSCARRPLDQLSAGHCPGVFDMTEERGPFGGSSKFFDVKGTLLGGTHSTDHGAYCNGVSMSVRAGVIPTCPRDIVVEPLCGPPKGRPSAAADAGSQR